MTTGDLESIFENYSGPIAHKLEHYIEIYDRAFRHLRSHPINVLEIGIFKGGSLNIWRQYFHPDSKIIGIDINPECAVHNDPEHNVFTRIGKQQDPKFLDALLSEFGNFDIVIDDGSHQMEHVKSSFAHLFPKLRDPCIYLIEDMCCSYWPNYGGGLRREGTVIEFAKSLIDLLNKDHWRSIDFPETIHLAHQIKTISFFNSVIVIEKGTFASTRQKFYGKKV